MRKFYLLCFTIFSCLAIQAQVQIPADVFASHEYSGDWQISMENGQVLVSDIFVERSNIQNGVYPEYLLLKVKNKTGNNIYDISNKQLQLASIKEILRSQGRNEQQVQLALEQNESDEGGFLSLPKNNKIFVQFKNNLTSAIITKMQFENYQSTNCKI